MREGRVSSVGIATRYGLAAAVIESFWWGGPPSLLYNGYRVFPRGLKRPGRGVDHPTPSSAEVKVKKPVLATDTSTTKVVHNLI